MKNKQGFVEIPFSWLFAIVIGAMIIFFAIYASVKLIGTQGTTTTAQTGKEITVLLNPLETGFGEEQTTTLSIASESQLINSCDTLGNFGEQKISVSQQNGGKWVNSGLENIAYNKYIFSNSTVQGKNFYLFSKPFNFPFKVSDLIYLTSTEDNYCFVNAPINIQEELSGLNQGNLFTKSCPSKSINVCFSSGTNCDISVDYQNLKTVTKEGKTVYFEGDALMYGAIFSDPAIYECQVQRLMARTKELTLIYNDKESNLAFTGCGTDVPLLGLIGTTSFVKDSSDLASVNSAAQDAERGNNATKFCKLW